MARLSDLWLEELRMRVPIEEVVSEYVPLRQKGHRYWGCCPFHREKTPSFSVNTDTQFYYCFGCKKTGTVITFLMEMERLEFMEAVKLLADRAHMPLPEMKKETTPGFSQEERERIYEANTLAARFFHSLLWTPEGAQVLSYLYSRGLNDSDIRRFGLGAAPKGWRTLTDMLVDKGFSTGLLSRAGLLVQKENNVYDMFRERAIFPIINDRGKVVGFGGRAMGDAQPKYLNTSDTPVFNKRQGLYCLNMAKKEREAGRLVLVEGYMDTVSLRKHGVTGVVATLGTALTEEQVRLMKRFAPEVWISYDGDFAGQKAALRALDMIEPFGLRAKVIDYPKGMDPDDFIKASGKAGFEKLQKYDATDYRLLRAKDGVDLDTRDGMTEYAMRACRIIGRLKNPIDIENYLRRLQQETGYDRNVLSEQIGVLKLDIRNREPAKQAPTYRTTDRKVKPDMDESLLLTLLVRGKISPKIVALEDLSEGLMQSIARELIAGRTVASILESVKEEDREFVGEALNCEITVESAEEALERAENSIREIRRKRAERHTEEILQKIPHATEEEKHNLYKQLMALTEGQNAN